MYGYVNVRDLHSDPEMQNIILNVKKAIDRHSAFGKYCTVNVYENARYHGDLVTINITMNVDIQIEHRNGDDAIFTTRLAVVGYSERARYDVVIMLKRTKEYVNDGTRSQTVEQSDKIYSELKVLFDLLGIEYIDMDGDTNAVKRIMDIITERYKSNGVI